MTKQNRDRNGSEQPKLKSRGLQPARPLETAGTPDAESFVASLECQLELYGRLKRLVERQRSLITAEDPSQLLALLAERDRVTSELSTLAKQLGPLREVWERVRVNMSADRRRRAAGLIQEVQKQLQDINATDADDVKLLEVRKRRVAAEMQRVGARGAMLSAYGRDRRPRVATRGLGTLDRTDENL
ncbi:MAG: hypothetical protein V3W34_13535 [Phycisphaerae bacterium]